MSVWQGCNGCVRQHIWKHYVKISKKIKARNYRGRRELIKEKHVRVMGWKKKQSLGGRRDEVTERPSAAHPDQEQNQPVEWDTVQIPLQTWLTSPGGHSLWCSNHWKKIKNYDKDYTVMILRKITGAWQASVPRGVMNEPIQPPAIGWAPH